MLVNILQSTVTTTKYHLYIIKEYKEQKKKKKLEKWINKRTWAFLALDLKLLFMVYRVIIIAIIDLCVKNNSEKEE